MPINFIHFPFAASGLVRPVLAVAGPAHPGPAVPVRVPPGTHHGPDAVSPGPGPAALAPSRSSKGSSLLDPSPICVDTDIIHVDTDNLG